MHGRERKEPKREMSPGNAEGTTYIPSGAGTPCNPSGGDADMTGGEDMWATLLAEGRE